MVHHHQQVSCFMLIIFFLIFFSFNILFLLSFIIYRILILDEIYNYALSHHQIYNNTFGTNYTTVLGHSAKYCTIPCYTPNVTTLPSHFMLQCVHTHPHCFPDDCLWSVARLTGISSKCHLSWSIIHLAIEPLSVILYFLSQAGTWLSNTSGQTHNQRQKVVTKNRSSI